MDRSKTANPLTPHQLMMTRGEGRSVTVITLSGKTGSGEIRFQSYDKWQRTMRAAKVWVICWGMAIVAVLIPFLHFFLVPVLVIAGPIAAWRISARSNAILGGETHCPECGQFTPIIPAYRLPISDLCGKCQAGFKVTE